MTTNDLEIPQFKDPITEQIQALADGQLEHESRLRLLRQIDASEEPHWRDLALALVERDLIGEALRFEEGNTEEPAPMKSGSRPLVWIAAAACVALGFFFLGWQLKPAQDLPVNTVAMQPQGSIDLDQEPEPLSTATIVENANRQLAHTGYEASLFTRLVRTSLKDGREVMIPVSQVVLDPRGL